MRKNAENQLSPRQIRAIELLAQGLGVEEAASRVGISRDSIRRWKKQAEFQKALRAAVREQVSLEVLQCIQKEEKYLP